MDLDGTDTREIFACIGMLKPLKPLMRSTSQIHNQTTCDRQREAKQYKMPRILSRSLLLSRRHNSSSKRVGGNKQSDGDSSQTSRKPTSPLRRSSNMTKHSIMSSSSSSREFDGIPRVPSDNWGQFVEIASISSPRTSVSDLGRLVAPPSNSGTSSTSNSGTTSPTSSTTQESEGWRYYFQ